MDINRVADSKHHKHTKKERVLLNLFFFFKFVRYIGVAILAFSALAFGIVYFLDKTIPTELESLDATATLKMFDALQENNRHHDAITLMEYKANIINDTPLELTYKSKLADSYVHVGDYSKAEKVLIDFWNRMPQYLNELDDTKLKDGVRYCYARKLYELYEQMGDKNNMIKYFDIYKKYYDAHSTDSMMAAAYNQVFGNRSISPMPSRAMVEYDSLVISYFDSHQAAIGGMARFVDKIMLHKELAASFKIRSLNKLIGWMLQEKKLFEAYPRIKQAVELALTVQFSDDYKMLGTLSDYCYQIHDVKTSKVLYKRYEEYLRKHYSEDDFTYLENYSRKFRYYDEDKDWDTLEAEIMKYCVGMRQQIANNIPSMTDEQRELFIVGFDKAHQVALELLQKHPTQQLAELCFDNISFRNGLLLRSNLALKNSIAKLDNKEVSALYNKLVKCRRDLVYESVSGRIIKHTDNIKGQINELEKELALKCTDFKTSKDISDYQHEQLQNRLSNKESIVEFVEDKGSLFALILDRHKGVLYVPIGNISFIQSVLQQSIEDIYHNVQLTDFIWRKIKKIIPEASKVYYLPTGKFNQIAFGSLYLGQNRYLCDVVDLCLLQDPTALINKEQLLADAQLFGSSSKIGMVSLWGGIDYGMTIKPSLDNNKRNAIKRGEALTPLLFTKLEVQTIAHMLKDKAINHRVYEKDMASEASFMHRSGKGDYVLHISTHGFFNDSTTQNNSMLSSGLFFAGANHYWNNNAAPIIQGEDDGILSAAEIANTNLSGCSLVVLSACETGLGFSNSSEGIYGLQRAFKLAGAKKILMSLWEVDDRATTLLMTNFYRYLLQGKDANTALEASKKRVRKEYPSPRDWGAFVLLN